MADADTAVADARPARQEASPDIELPACFYLGREYDLASKTPLDRPVMYDARDLTTHGVVVGMTGSGKTGLCISLLEEAAIDGIPCILIDPKGDLTNLLLQFPNLAPDDFKKWLNPEDARQKGLTLEDHAAQLAEQWRKGLADSGQTPERIARLQASSEWRIYTPGSEAGLPLSILQTFQAPQGQIPREALNQKIDVTTTALLGLTGISSDPVQSREHILIAQLLLHAWGNGRNLDLPELIAQIQSPPLSKIGAFDVDTFYPEKDRLKLAVALNNILAAPSFSTWIAGEPLDLSRMLSGGSRPRQLIFYVAHLEDAQRMFFVTLLLEEVLSWTRKQPGTTGLRAIVYFDEVFGYLPPHPGNPPSKLPLMTLLKQARAFGVGILLATQNPVDLDYKALSNAGTWFVGKLQTDRDKARLVEGLESVAAEQGTLGNRAYLETVISALSSRIFLLHDIHRGQPMLFQSRHALSFLRGPMTRDQVAQLMAPLKEAPAQTTAPSEVEAPAPVAIPLCRRCHAELVTGAPACAKCGTPVAGSVKVEDRAFKADLQRGAATPTVPGTVQPTPPSLPADVTQFNLPLASPARPAGADLVYQPRVLGVAVIAFLDKKKGITQRQTYRLLVPPPAPGQAVAWHAAEKLAGETVTGAEPQAQWAEVPESVNTARKLKTLEKSFAAFLYDHARLTLLENNKLGLVGQPGEDVMAFRGRCRTAALREADQEVAAEKLKYQPKFAALGAAVPEPPAPQVDHQGSVLDLVNPLWWLGFKGKPNATPAPPASDKVARLEADWLNKQGGIHERWRKVGEEYADLALTPRRQDVQVVQFGLAWVPFWQVKTVEGKAELVPAYR